MLGVARLVQIGIGLAAIPILARLLDPEDFGLVAMVAVFSGLASILADSGLSMATVQREDFTHQQASNLFWAATVLGLVIAGLLTSFSPVIGWFYGEPRLVPIACALSLSYLVNGATLQHQALMRRGMEFKQLATIDITSQIIAQSVAIGWAWSFFERPEAYWALVLIPIVASLSRLVLTWSICRWRPSRPRAGAGTLELLQFGANLSGFQVVNYITRNFDQLIIGVNLGDVNLGYYERARRLLLQPTRQVAPAITPAVISGLSRLSNAPDRYWPAFYESCRLLFWAGALAVGLLAATSGPLVVTVLGPKWEPVVPVFQASIPSAWYAIAAIACGWAYTSLGHVRRRLYWGVFNSIVMLSVVASSVSYGIVYVAAAISAMNVLLTPVAFLICFHGTPIRFPAVMALLLRPLVVAGLSATASLAACTHLGLANNNWQGLVALGAFYCVCAALLLVIPPRNRREILAVVASLRTRRATSS